MKYLLVFILVVLLPESALAQAGVPAVSVESGEDGSQTYTVTIQILILMTALTVLPAIVLMMTSFTRLVIVFAILRHALGTPQTPPNQVLIGLARFLTFFIMAPVLDKAYTNGIGHYIEGEI